MKRIEDLENIFFFGEKLVEDEKFEQIRAFIDKTGVIQSQPQIARKIIELSNNENVMITDIEKIVSSDPAIAAKILKMANSSFYKLTKEVSSIKRAILILGITMIKDIALSIAILDMFKTKNKGILSALWDHAIAVSIGSKLLSVNYSEDIDSDACFTVGLLHDVGKMLMAKEEKYLSVTRAIAEEGVEKALDIERELYGFDHAELGAVMATVWDFTPEMYYIILNHHDAETLINVDRSLISVPEQYLWNTAIVSAADTAAHFHGFGTEKRDVLSDGIIKFLNYQSKEHFTATYLEEFKLTYFREKSIFD